MKQLTLQTDTDKLRSYLNGEVEAELSAALQSKLERIDYCRQLIAEYMPEYKIVSQLVAHFRINRNQAYNLLYETKIVYNPQKIRLEKLLENIGKTRHMAEMKQDLKALTACDKNEAYLIKEFFGGKEEDFWKQLEIPEPIFLYKPNLVRKDLENTSKLLEFMEKLKAQYEPYGEVVYQLPMNSVELTETPQGF